MGGKVTNLRNLVTIGYNYCIHRGHNIYPNRLGFLNQQVVSACSTWFAEQFRDLRGPFWRVGPPRLVWPMWSHEGIRVYTPTRSQKWNIGGQWTSEVLMLMPPLWMLLVKPVLEL
jgi:hypothetical protein